MRPQRPGRRTWILLGLAVVALIAEWYLLTAQHQRELARVEASVLAQASATAEAIARQTTPTAVPTATPAAQTPREAVEGALRAALELMRHPQEPAPTALEQVADAGFLRAFQRQIDHLKERGLRLSPRSGYELLSVEQTLNEPDGAEFVTQERWVYEEQTPSGEVVRCLVETSAQRYRLERRQGRWVVTDLTVTGTPAREPCAATPDATSGAEGGTATPSAP